MTVFANDATQLPEPCGNVGASPRVELRMHRSSASGRAVVQGLVSAILIIHMPFAMAAPGEAAERVVTVQPQESHAVLRNPGRGWMSMFGPEVFGANTPSGVPTTLFYVRIMWSDLHKGDDLYDWSALDERIALARKGGQQVMVHLMPVYQKSGNMEWMRRAGYRGYEFCADGFCELWVPDLDDRRVREQVEKFMAAYGARYNGHPDIDSIEVGFLGMYGEGHFYGAKPSVPMPSRETQAWLADLHYRSFPDKPMIGPVSWNASIIDYMYQTYGSTRGAGIFFNCWGDYPKGGRWAHMTNAYPQAIAKKPRAWEKGILKLEPCGTMADWPGDVGRALDWAIANHASYIGNKNAPVPASAIPVIQDKIRKIGYRYVVRKLEHPQGVARGRELPVRIEFDNVGNAPAYHDYVWTARLVGAGGSPVHRSASSVKHVLPGSHTVEFKVPVPADLPAGRYGLSIGLVRPGTVNPVVNLAIEGRDADGWYPLSSVSIE